MNYLKLMRFIKKKYNHFSKLKRKLRERNDSSDDDDDGIDPFQFLKSAKNPNLFMEGNHIYFRTDVTQENVAELCNLIDQYNREVMLISANCPIGKLEPLPLYIHITSNGGDLFSGFMAYDYIRNSNVNVYTVSEGYTVSSGSIMFMGGKKRLMSRNSYFLAHQLSQTYSGTIKFLEMQDDVRNAEELMKRICCIYLTNLRKTDNNDILTVDKLEDHMRHDIYWNYDECARYGIIDGEYTNCIDSDFSDRNKIHPENSEKNVTINPSKIIPSKKFISDVIKIAKTLNEDNDENADGESLKNMSKYLKNTETNKKQRKK